MSYPTDSHREKHGLAGVESAILEVNTSLPRVFATCGAVIVVAREPLLSFEYEQVALPVQARSGGPKMLAASIRGGWRAPQ